MLNLASPRRTLGFSLIETMVTLSVLVLTLALVMPEVISWVQGLKVRNAAESMRAGMERARMEALKTNGNVGFWLVADTTSKVPSNNCAQSSTSASWVVSATVPDGACNAAALKSGAMENSDALTVSALTSAAAAATQVSFNGLGQAVTANPGTIQTVDLIASNGTGRRLRVVVEPGGAIRMCDRDVAANDPRACPVLP